MNWKKKDGRAQDHECIFCPRQAESWHHVRISAINCGMGTKPHDWFRIPVCGALGTLGCHRECQEYLIPMHEQCLKVLEFRVSAEVAKSMKRTGTLYRSDIIKFTMETFREETAA